MSKTLHSVSVSAIAKQRLLAGAFLKCPVIKKTSNINKLHHRNNDCLPFFAAISKELEEFNVQTQLLVPLFVVTKMNLYSTSVMKGSILVPDVEKYTKSAIFTMGKSEKTTGYWSHGLQVSPIVC